MSQVSNLNPNQPDDPALVREVLVSRLLDGRGDESDWSTFRTMSAAEPAVWEEVITSCRHTRRLEREFEYATAGIESSDMPAVRLKLGSSTPSRGAFLGWAAAAVFAFGMIIQQSGLVPSSRLGGTTAGIAAAPLSPDEYLAKYIDAGRKEGFILEEPSNLQVVQVRKTDQGHEVIFVRPLLEKRIVTGADFRTLGVTEDGTLTLIPAAAPITKAKY